MLLLIFFLSVSFTGGTEVLDQITLTDPNRDGDYVTLYKMPLTTGFSDDAAGLEQYRQICENYHPDVKVVGCGTSYAANCTPEKNCIPMPASWGCNMLSSLSSNTEWNSIVAVQVDATHDNSRYLYAINDGRPHHPSASNSYHAVCGSITIPKFTVSPKLQLDDSNYMYCLGGYQMVDNVYKCWNPVFNSDTDQGRNNNKHMHSQNCENHPHWCDSGRACDLPSLHQSALKATSVQSMCSTHCPTPPNGCLSGHQQSGCWSYTAPGGQGVEYYYDPETKSVKVHGNGGWCVLSYFELVIDAPIVLSSVESRTCQWHEMNKWNKIINGEDFFGFECPPNQIISELRLEGHGSSTVLDNNPTAILCCELGGHSSVTNTCSDFYSSADGQLETATCEGNSAFTALYDVVDVTLDQSKWQYQATKGMTCCDIDYDTDYGRNLDLGIDRDQCETVAHTNPTGSFNVACPENMVLVEIKDNDIAYGVQEVHQIECCRVHNAAAPSQAPTVSPTTSEPSPAPTTSCYDCLVGVHGRSINIFDKDDFVGEVEACLSYCCS